VAIEIVKRRVQTRIERKRMGPDEWLVVTRRPLADDRTVASREARDATDQDARYRYQYYLTPTDGAEVAFQEPSLGELGRVIKAAACIETSLKRGKGDKARHNYRYISAEIKQPSSILGRERLYAIFTSAKSHNCCAGKGSGT